MGEMHRTNLDHSPRLRRVLDCLRRGPHTTWEIIQEARVGDVSSVISELRFPPNNIPIDGKYIRKGVYLYSLAKGQLEMKLG